MEMFHTITDWAAHNGEKDFLPNIFLAIKMGLLQKGNIAFLLLAELLRKLLGPSIFVYSEAVVNKWPETV